MKKIYLLFFVIFLSFSFAQTTLSTAVDFTVTTTNGGSFNLFSKLDQGKYVLVDFFFTTCPPCIATAPYYKEAYENYGCNEAGVYFISIDYGDTDAEVIAFEATHLTGATNLHAASGTEGGGDAVCATYGITAYPTYILIAPDRNIVEQDMWPISSAASFTNYLTTQNGITQASCSQTASTETIDNIHVSLYPNPVVDFVNIASIKPISVKSVVMYNTVGQIVFEKVVNENEDLSFDVSNLESGTYFLNITTDNGVKTLKFLK